MDCGEGIAAMAIVYRRCALLPDMEDMNCQDLAVPMLVMQHVVNIESSYNPYAIGVVGGRLVRQPGNLPEALATVRMLESRGYNFSLGLAQVNRYNLGKYGLTSYENAFQTCPNLQAGARILADCHARSGNDWGRAFSCYYSGNFITGYRHGYVQKIFASMRNADTHGSGATAIDVVGKHSPRLIDFKRYPVDSTTPAVMRRVVEGATRLVAQHAMTDGSPQLSRSATPGDQRAVQVTTIGVSTRIQQATPAPIAGTAGPQGQADKAFVF